MGVLARVRFALAPVSVNAVTQPTALEAIYEATGGTECTRRLADGPPAGPMIWTSTYRTSMSQFARHERSPSTQTL